MTSAPYTIIRTPQQAFDRWKDLLPEITRKILEPDTASNNNNPDSNPTTKSSTYLFSLF
jgi:hypothetical protein